MKKISILISVFLIALGIGCSVFSSIQYEAISSNFIQHEEYFINGNVDILLIVLGNVGLCFIIIGAFLLISMGAKKVTEI